MSATTARERSALLAPPLAAEIPEAAQGAPEASAYRVRGYEPRDEAQVVALLARTLPRWARCRDPVAVWRWKHGANPFGASRTLVALLGERVVGSSSRMLWRLARGERSYTALRSVDLASEPALQRTGIASALAVVGWSEVQRSGLPLGFYTPNDNSAKLAGRDGRRFAGVLRPELLVRRPLPALRAWWRARGGAGGSRGAEARGAFRKAPLAVEDLLRDRRAAVEDLLAADRARDRGRFRTEHSWESLCWRYARHPELRYWAVATERRGALEGLLVFRAEDHHSARRVVLEDLLLRERQPRALRSLGSELGAVVSADLVQHAFPESISIGLLGAGLRLHSRGYRLVTRVLDPELGDIPARLESWQLTLGDLREI